MIDTFPSQKPFYFPANDFPAPQILFIQHFNLLCDARMDLWYKAINSSVTEKDVVVELGSGTGILSMIAARKAKRVYAVEVDSHLAQYSRHVIKRNGLSHKITVIEADARDVTLPEKADVLICEMLDTALIKENQIQVVNSALDNITHAKTRILPNKVFTSVVASHTNYNFFGFEIPLPYFETMEVRKTTDYYTKPYTYHIASMNQKNDPHVKTNFKVKVTKRGVVNSIKMITRVEVCNGVMCEPSYWFNPPLVLPVEPIKVQEGDFLRISLSYLQGGGLKTLDYEVEKI